MKLYRDFTVLAASGLMLSLTACATTVADSPDEATAEQASAVEAPTGQGKRGGGPGRFGAMFAQADANKDGQLTLEEARTAALERFTEADANKDGVLDESERDAMRPAGNGKPGEGRGAGKGRTVADLDKNGDGKISRDEAPPRMAEHFDEADTNNDGAVDQAELDTMRVAHRGARGEGKGGGRGPSAGMGRGPCAGAGNDEGECVGMGPGAGTGQGMGPGAGMGHGPGMGMGRGPGGPGMANPDADGDGQISKDEVLDRVNEWFKRIDANGDGVATQAEHDALRAKRPSRPGAAK